MIWNNLQMGSYEMIISYLDDITMTITLAFGSGNSNFYHISVIEFTISLDPFR